MERIWAGIRWENVSGCGDRRGRRSEPARGILSFGRNMAIVWRWRWRRWWWGGGGGGRGEGEEVEEGGGSGSGDRGGDGDDVRCFRLH